MMELPPSMHWVDAKAVFGVDRPAQVPAFREATEHVPALDPGYRFQPDVTQAILLGLVHNRKVLIQGFHGTGKSTHLEQVAARLNWPCLRVNLDGQLSRLDLIGRDAVVLRDGLQVTEFLPGILPFAMQQPMLLVLDEYDAGRPEVMFVLQRLLEPSGRLTLLDQNRVISPHPQFRLMATSNTVGLGNLQGLYHGTQVLNHAQLDRWSIVATLDYLDPAEEAAIITAQVPAMATAAHQSLLSAMVALANLTRKGFASADLSSLMSPRTVIHWAQTYIDLLDVRRAFALSFLNRCDPAERPLIAEFYQRCFDEPLVPDQA